MKNSLISDPFQSQLGSSWSLTFPPSSFIFLFDFVTNKIDKFQRQGWLPRLLLPSNLLLNSSFLPSSFLLFLELNKGQEQQQSHKRSIGRLLLAVDLLLVFHHPDIIDECPKRGVLLLSPFSRRTQTTENATFVRALSLFMVIIGVPPKDRNLGSREQD